MFKFSVSSAPNLSLSINPPRASKHSLVTAAGGTPLALLAHKFDASAIVTAAETPEELNITFVEPLPLSVLRTRSAYESRDNPPGDATYVTGDDTDRRIGDVRARTSNGSIVASFLRSDGDMYLDKSGVESTPGRLRKPCDCSLSLRPLNVAERALRVVFFFVDEVLGTYCLRIRCNSSFILASP